MDPAAATDQLTQGIYLLMGGAALFVIGVLFKAEAKKHEAARAEREEQRRKIRSLYGR